MLGVVRRASAERLVLGRRRLALHGDLTSLPAQRKTSSSPALWLNLASACLQTRFLRTLRPVKRLGNLSCLLISMIKNTSLLSAQVRVRQSWGPPILQRPRLTEWRSTLTPGVGRSRQAGDTRRSTQLQRQHKTRRATRQLVATSDILVKMPQFREAYQTFQGTPVCRWKKGPLAAF